MATRKQNPRTYPTSKHLKTGTADYKTRMINSWLSYCTKEEATHNSEKNLRNVTWFNQKSRKRPDRSGTPPHFLARPISPTVKKWRSAARQESTATRILPALGDLVDRFLELVSTNYATGIHRAIRSFAEQQAIPPLQLSQALVTEQHLMQALSINYHTIMDVPVAQLRSDVRDCPKRRGNKSFLVHFATERREGEWGPARG